MEAQFEALSELVKNGQKLNFGQALSLIHI